MARVPYEIAPNSVVEIAAEYVLNGQQNIALFHYAYVDTDVISDGYEALGQILLTLSDDMDFMANFGACLSSDAGDVTFSAQWIYPVRWAYRVFGTLITPSGPANAAPQNVAAAITKRGTIATRDAIGTTHMGAVPREWLVNGFVVQPVGEPYTAFADLIPLDLVDGTEVKYAPILYKRSAPEESIFIAEAFVQQTSRIMRRRTVGLGS